MEGLNKTLKNIVNIIGFISLIIFLFCKISWIFRSNSLEAREDIVGFKNQGDIDVVFYGGSPLLRGYQPLEAYHRKGYTSYNYVITFEKNNLLKAFIEESRTTNEALLYVCDIRAFPLLSSDTIEEAALRNWSDSVSIFSLARVKGITSFLKSWGWGGKELTAFYFDIFKYHSNYEILANAEQWDYLKSENIYNVDKGYEAVVDNIPYEIPEVTDECGELNERQLFRLNELLDYFDQEKIQVLFIASPYVISDSDWKILNTCNKIIQERGYNFINFNSYYDEMNLDFETDFYDAGHLNYLGSQKYTRYLTDYLSDNYELPDHRGDDCYSDWNDDYITFLSLQEEWGERNASIIEDHKEAKEIGDQLSDITDFLRWFELIKNENFTVIITKNNNDICDAEDIAIYVMSQRWGIDIEESYIGIWQGEECLFSTYEKDRYEGEVKINNGRIIIPYSISLGDDQILIGEKKYSNASSGIQAIIIDNNYGQVIDNVNIYTEEKGINLIRY